MRRRGVTILELTVAIILAGVLLAGVGQLLTVVAAQQREGERRAAAMHEAANQMERLAARPWSELTSESAADLQLSEEAAEALPEGMLSVMVNEVESGEDADAIPGRRIEVAVSWRNSAGRQVEPVRLVAWRFPEEAAP
ncbi:MAG: type II secretion system GspH family protein [Planctomycetes bacterium]|nr:type II secretion system GspH family protein [Planctomycetota bacterium]